MLPSRATLLTGLSTVNHGVVDNNNASEEGLTFFPQYLQQAGYATGFFGKWHMGAETDAPRPGFSKWVSFRGQGTYGPSDGLPPARVAAGERHTLNVDGVSTPRRGYITDELTDYAMDWLASGRDQTKPFFLYLSHKAVHSDFVPAERHRTQYADLRIELPASSANTEENYRGKPMWVRNQRNSWHGVDFPTTPTRTSGNTSANTTARCPRSMTASAASSPGCASLDWRRTPSSFSRATMASCSATMA